MPLSSDFILATYFCRIDKSKIYAPFLSTCVELIKECVKHNTHYYAVSGFRDPNEQQKLYDIGRKTDLDKKPVTNARPYSSLHNYGLAIDFCLDKDATRSGLQPSYKFSDYKLLADQALALGLKPGFYFEKFPEGPHIQAKTPYDLATLKAHFLKGGLPGVWAFLTTSK